MGADAEDPLKPHCVMVALVAAVLEAVLPEMLCPRISRGFALPSQGVSGLQCACGTWSLPVSLSSFSPVVPVSKCFGRERMGQARVTGVCSPHAGAKAQARELHFPLVSAPKP